MQKVVIIGAGLSGLIAARDLVAAGVEVEVLDARDRPGGRLKPGHLSTGRLVDAGGQFSGPALPDLLALAEEFGIEWVPLPYEPDTKLVRMVNGVRFVEEYPFEQDTAAGEEFHAISQLIDEFSSRVNLDKPADSAEMMELDAVSTAEWLDRNVHTEGARALLDLEMNPTGATDRVSMLSFVLLQARFGGWEGHEQISTGHFVGGSAQIPLRLAEAMADRIRLSTVVTRITQRSDDVAITAGDTEIVADAVIVATAGAANIAYEPSLPAPHVALADGFVPFHGAKLVMEYDRPFWRTRGLSGTSFGGQYACLALDVSTDEDSGLLCAMVFHPSTTDPTVSDDEIVRLALDDLATQFGPEALKPTATFIENWSQDPWSAGPGNGFKPGALTAAGDALTAPVGRITWAGADRATSDYMEGAIRAGKRSAAQVLGLLSSG